MTATPDRIVHTIDKRDGEEIRATLSTFKGALYFSLRVYFRSEDGEWHPTKKGITLAAERLEELEAAVAALRTNVDAEPARRPDRIQRYVRDRQEAAGR